jgi:hypothetical protein
MVRTVSARIQTWDSGCKMFSIIAIGRRNVTETDSMDS